MVELSDEVLHVHRLNVVYHGQHADVPVLNDIDISIGRGEFVSLVGESGSGKTTLSSAILGLLPSTARIVSGDLQLSGRNVVAAPEFRLSRYRGRLAGLVPQDPGSSLNPVKTIGSQIGEIFRLRGHRYSQEQTRQEIIRLLTEVEITNPAQRLTQYPHELSGGIKQRILIAIAFALNPRLIVADEPTSALDVTVQKQVLDLFQRLAAEHGTSVLLVTHDISLATDYADRIIVLKSGKVVEDQPTDRLVSQPKSPYTTSLLNEAFADHHHSGPDAVNEAISDPVIKVSGLSKVYGKQRSDSVFALRDVNFEAHRGRTVGLVGESGSGKSTIAKILIKLIDQTSGELSVLGNEVHHLDARGRRGHWKNIQLVHQNPDSALDPRATVAQIVREPLDSHRIGSRSQRRATVKSLISRVLLDESYLSKRPGELSGGQRQRVAIARALALNSPILILDEPLSALDVVTQSQVIELLVRLQRENNLTYLFISHDLSIVRRLSDDVIVLRRGEIVEQGRTDDVFDRPQHEYTRALIEAIPGRRYGRQQAPALVEGGIRS